MISVPQLCRKRLEDVTNLSYTIFVNGSAGVWVSWKIGKVEKEKALNHHKQECNKKGCVVKVTER